MTDKELKEIRKKISCPQFEDKHYGEWGILTLNQRRTIKRLLDFIESQEEYINRLQEENERLKNECKNQSTLWSKHFEQIFETAKETIKAEAYKEFAERLKDGTGYYDWEIKDMVYTEEEIDNLLKELVGEDNTLLANKKEI